MGVGIFTASSYFDFDDFSDPVKHYVNDGLYFYFAPGFTKLVSIYVKENSYELSDSIFRYGPSTDKNKFISTDDFNVDLKKKKMMTVQFYKLCILKINKTITIIILIEVCRQKYN